MQYENGTMSGIDEQCFAHFDLARFPVRLLILIDAVTGNVNPLTRKGRELDDFRRTRQLVRADFVVCGGCVAVQDLHGFSSSNKIKIGYCFGLLRGY